MTANVSTRLEPVDIERMISPGVDHQLDLGVIATGLVVVGDVIGTGSAQEQSVVSETPNLAARLQSLADAPSRYGPETTVPDWGRRLVCSRFW